jgi:hypothetical protein
MKVDKVFTVGRPLQLSVRVGGIAFNEHCTASPPTAGRRKILPVCMEAINRLSGERLKGRCRSQRLLMPPITMPLSFVVTSVELSTIFVLAPVLASTDQYSAPLLGRLFRYQKGSIIRLPTRLDVIFEEAVLCKRIEAGGYPRAL